MAQQVPFQTSFKSITAANGLPGNYVFEVTEDASGFLWAGTDKGICRYNGASWEVFDTDDGLPGNYVIMLRSDRHNGLWMSISEKGLFHFDIATKKTTKLPLQLPNGYMVETDTAGNLLCYKTGTYMEEYKSKKVDVFTKKISQVALNHPAASMDRNILTVHYPTSKIKHVFIFNEPEWQPPVNTNQPTTFFHHIKDPLIKSLSSGFEIKDNWIITDQFAVYVHLNQHLYIRKNYTEPGNYNRSYTAVVGNKHYLGLWNEGLYCVENHKQLFFYSGKEHPQLLHMNHLYTASNGNLLIATLGGGISILPKNNSSSFALQYQPVISIGSNQQQFYTLANGYVTIFHKSGIQKSFFTCNDALSAYITNDSLLIGSFRGLHLYKIKPAGIRLEKTIPITAGISTIFRSGDSIVFSTYGSGWVVSKNFRDTVHIKNFPFGNIEKTVGLPNGYAALSYEDGFFIVNKQFSSMKLFNKKNGLLSSYVICVHTHNDSLWVGTKNGVSIVHNGNVVQTISFADGFKGTKAYTLFHDRKGRLWVVSDQHLHLYINGRLQAMGSVPLIQEKEETVTAAHYYVKQDILLVATQKKMMMLEMDKIEPVAATSQPIIAGITVDGKAQTADKYFTASFNSEAIHFKMEAANPNPLLSGALFYKLNNEAWTQAPDSMVISFTNLRAGNYTIWAKTVNADGYESKVSNISSFTIRPPFYLSWWFIAMCVAATGVVTWQMFRYIVKRKYKAQLQQLKIQQELETERQRISRDLHDNMGAYTSALISNVQQLQSTIGETEQTQKMQANAESILSSLRETIWILNNKDVTLNDFSDRFKNYCFKLLRNFEHINFEASETITNNLQLPAATAVHLNKILQEIIQNTIKHASATSINYTITEAGPLQITLADNGCGFDEQTIKEGFGLDNIKWRAKEINFSVVCSSVKSNGTKYTITQNIM
jgi:signal transduction histidine kinase